MQVADVLIKPMLRTFNLIVVAEKSKISLRLNMPNTVNTYSDVSRLKNKSIAAENAAKAKPPPRAAFGPEFRASIPPATKPAATGFTISFLARY